MYLYELKKREVNDNYNSTITCHYYQKWAE